MSPKTLLIGCVADAIIIDHFVGLLISVPNWRVCLTQLYIIAEHSVLLQVTIIVGTNVCRDKWVIITLTEGTNFKVKINVAWNFLNYTHQLSYPLFNLKVILGTIILVKWKCVDFQPRFDPKVKVTA